MANARESLSASEVKCGTCGQQKEDNVVACDLCDMWHHYTCVSVSNAVEEKSWICRPCKERNGGEEAGLPAASSPTSATPMAAVAGPSSTPRHPPVYPVAPSSRSGSRVNKTRLDLLLEQMAEEEEIDRREFESKRRFTRRRYEILLANTEDAASLLDELAIDGDDRVAAWVSGDAAESMQCKMIEPSAHALNKKPVALSQPAVPVPPVVTMTRMFMCFASSMQICDVCRAARVSAL
uniref:PHD-type domain-containing protein n=1 Tax=Anopheles merus TaxID=30066 RepID=A0A182VKY8_ANOME